MTGDVRTFNMGLWNGYQIDDLSVYNDGVIVAAPSETSVIEGFLDDLYDFVKEQFGLEAIPGSEEVRLYESAVVVAFSTDIAARFKLFEDTRNRMSKFYQSYGHSGQEFSAARIEFHHDPTLPSATKPIPFKLERRINEPFSANRWYSMAPLKTIDHLRVLTELDVELA